MLFSYMCLYNNPGYKIKFSKELVFQSQITLNHSYVMNIPMNLPVYVCVLHVLFQTIKLTDGFILESPTPDPGLTSRMPSMC